MPFRRLVLCTCALLVSSAPASLFAVEHVTLRNGSEFECVREEPVDGRLRLYLVPSKGQSGSGYLEVPTDSVARVEIVPDPPEPAAQGEEFTPAEMNQILVRAGAIHHIDADLLASVIKAESNGNAHAVSRAGAQGLMQLMPATASELGVSDSFAPEQNIGGGTAYLDQLLTRYHDNAVLAVAAYNAGPAAVDHYHGVPPYRETRAYVARVIREFNRRKLAGISSATARAR